MKVGNNMSYFAENYNSVRYPYESGGKNGLRKCQLGAIHAIAAHFTNSNTPAIITMPTGTGKTAVLILAAFVLRAQRVLVITPSKLVRSQIKEEFKELKTLIKINALVQLNGKPKIYELKGRVKSSEEWLNLKNYDVIVSTPMSISPGIKGIPNPPEEIFDLILIDEAHHSRAFTWDKIIDTFKSAKKILFTATPFRRDKKEILGKFIYNYSISDAYKDKIFDQIEYVPVTDTGMSEDVLIAEKTEQVLMQDRSEGYKHFLMVRTDKMKRAKQLDQVYLNNTNLKLKVIDSKHSYKNIKEVIQKLKNGEIDGVICVNMLGEGFDFPNLKIAAIHAPYKSLETTLQFIGRFARTNAKDIGTAKFIAVPSSIEIEKQKLFEEGAVWQDIITNLSKNKIEEEIEKQQTLSTFNCVLNKDDETNDLSLTSLMPYAHVRVYSTDKFSINCNIELPDNLVIINKHVSEEYFTVILIAKEVKNPKWTKINMFQIINYELFIIHYNCQHKLLFINSTRKTEDNYQSIAEQYADKFIKKLPLNKLNRVLSNLKNTEFFSIGMRNSVQTSNTESYRIISGTNAQKAIKKTDGRLYQRGHCFCKGIDKDRKITVGYSSGSKVWSNSYYTVPQFIKWCDYIASKLAYSGNVFTNSGLDYIPVSEEVTAIPDKAVISIDWNKNTYLKPPILTYEEKDVSIDNFQLLDVIVELSKKLEDKIEILFSISGFKFIINFSLKGNRYFTSEDNIVNTFSVYRNFIKISLLDYLNENPLCLYFTDFSSLVGNEYYRKNFDDSIQIDEKLLKPIDWKSKNVDIEHEIGVLNNGCISIQHFLNDYLEQQGNDFVYYDHGTGEIADFISIKEFDSNILIQFYHCKGSGGKKPGDRVNDIYEVCGQVIKSVLWTDPNKLKIKLEDRMKVHESSDDNKYGFRRDTLEKFKKILEIAETKRLFFEILLVQPGILKSNLSPKISNVLAAADDFCVNQGYSHIKVFCS